MKPAEYAKELGISRQAVYAKIKKGILKSKNVEGKLYILIDNTVKNDVSSIQNTTTNKTKEVQTNSPSKLPNYEVLLQAKDETISVLKGTVKELKKSNKQISTTLKGEINLLKEAFYEMRTLYAQRLERKKSSEIEVATEDESIEVQEDSWIGLKKFFKQQGVKKEKQQQKIIKRFKKAYKKGDERFAMIGDKLKLNTTKTYKDLLK